MSTSKKGWTDDPLAAQMRSAHFLANGLREAHRFLSRDDVKGVACSECRGTERHYGPCSRRLALDAIENALKAGGACG